MSSSYTLDFTQYSITDGGNETTYNQHDLNTIFSGDWKFEDISTIDTGGLTAWGKQIEVISQSNSNWTIVLMNTAYATSLFSANGNFSQHIKLSLINQVR